MACSICQSAAEVSDRRNAAVPLTGALMDRVCQALAITGDARCFAGPMPRACSRCVSNIETIESALRLRGKMRQQLDLLASHHTVLPLPSGVSRSEAHAVTPACSTTRLDVGSSIADRGARSPGHATQDACVEVPAVVTEADSSSSVKATDGGKVPSSVCKPQSGNNKEKPHPDLSASGTISPVSAHSPSKPRQAASGSTVKVELADTDVVDSKDASITCTVNRPRKEFAVKIEVSETGGDRSSEGDSFEDERQRSPVPAVVPPAAGRAPSSSISIGKNSTAPLSSPPERLLRSSAAAAAAVVVAGATAPLDAPAALHQLQSRKAARSLGSTAAAAVGDSLPLLIAGGSSGGSAWSSSRAAAGSGSGGRRRPLSRAGGGTVPALVVCRHCGKGFNSYSVLRVHLRSHTGEKPFTCRHCGVGFTQSQHARSHERRVHERTDGKQFRCSTCNAAYWRLGMLKAHERIHAAGGASNSPLVLQQQQLQPPDGAAPADGCGGDVDAASNRNCEASHRGGGRLGRSSGVAAAGAVATAVAPRGAATVTVLPRGPARSTGGRKRAAASVRRTADVALEASYRRLAADSRHDASWYDDEASSSDDGFDLGGDELMCESNGAPGSIAINRRGRAAAAAAGEAAMMVDDQSKRYCCDECDDTFWKFGHLLRHKTLVHSSVDEVMTNGVAEPQQQQQQQQVFGISPAESAEVFDGVPCASSTADPADHAVAESNSRDGLDGSCAADAAAVLLGVGDESVGALPVASPVPRQAAAAWPAVGGGRKPRKRLKTDPSLTSYVDGLRVTSGAVPAAGTLHDPSSEPTTQDETDVPFQSSSVFPRGDHDWVELSGISLSSVAGGSSAATTTSPLHDGTQSRSALSTPVPVVGDWGLKCAECNEQFAFKLGLERHIKTVHLRKNKYACGVCTASFMMEKTLKHHVENAHSVMVDDVVGAVETGEQPSLPSDAAVAIERKRFAVGDTSSNAAGDSNRHDDRASAAVAKPTSAVMAANDRRHERARHLLADTAAAAAAAAGSANANVACDAALPSPAMTRDARPDVGVGVGGSSGPDGFGYRCKECSSTFRSKAVLRAHVRVHQASDEFPYGCDVCGARFMAEKYLTQHAVVHGEKQFECKVCRLRFSRRASLQQHVSCSHAGQCDYACDSCTATFNNPTALTKHKHRMHTDDHYDAAASSFSAISAESGDVRLSSLVRQQQQQQPGSSLSRRSDSSEAQQSRNHRQQPLSAGGVGIAGEAAAVAKELSGSAGVIYPPARFFECETCRSSFGSLSALSLHKHRVHGVLTPRSAARASVAGALPSAADGEHGVVVARVAPAARSAAAAASFTAGGGIGGSSHLHCHLCNRKFSSMSSRAAHMRLHTGERPYACNVCGRRFVQSVHLKSHMRLHTGEKPYVCGVCGMAHRHRSGFMKHMRNHHGSAAVDMKVTTASGRISRRAGLGRTRTEAAAIISRVSTAAPPAHGSSSSLLDGISESQSDLSRDFADERDSCGDSIADGDGTRRSESSASTLPLGSDPTDLADLPNAAALNANTVAVQASRVVVRDVGSSGVQRSFSCSKCGERFGLKFLLKQHMKKRHRLVMAE